MQGAFVGAVELAWQQVDGGSPVADAHQVTARTRFGDGAERSGEDELRQRTSAGSRLGPRSLSRFDSHAASLRFPCCFAGANALGKVEQVMYSAERLDVRPLKADTAHIDWDAEVATAHIDQHHPLP